MKDMCHVLKRKLKLMATANRNGEHPTASQSVSECFEDESDAFTVTRHQLQPTRNFYPQKILFKKNILIGRTGCYVYACFSGNYDPKHHAKLSYSVSLEILWFNFSSFSGGPSIFFPSYFA